MSTVVHDNPQYDEVTGLFRNAASELIVLVGRAGERPSLLLCILTG